MTAAVTTTAVPVVRRSDRPLFAGALAGPALFASAGIQTATREGSGVTRHLTSRLATGGAGWIQISTFVLAGPGVLAPAADVGRTPTGGGGRRALPIPVGIPGAGPVTSGLLPTDPENGFPVGAPDQPLVRMSWHSVAHSASVVAAHSALMSAAVVLTARCVGRRAVLPAVLDGATWLALVLPVPADHMSVRTTVNGPLAATWTTVLVLSPCSTR
ncbi:DUF998 domain-containing protein [Streptomyces sp. NPDC014623]|uniref:DUF998 domain-containing protein n=1 Tax=Streptomyces sp. NPDC014623 TaxID=3364875 RepID=UPI003700B952